MQIRHNAMVADHVTGISGYNGGIIPEFDLVEYAFVQNDNGYTYEAFFPFETLLAYLSDDGITVDDFDSFVRRIGFEIQVTDSDEPVDPSICKLMWNDDRNGNMAWNDNRYFGHLYLSHDLIFNKKIHISENGSDETGDGSDVNPYATIQRGFDEAINGDTIVVAQGTYTENLVFHFKEVNLLGGFEDAGWTRDIENYTTIIDGGGVESVINIEGVTGLIEGFTLQNGSAPDYGGGGLQVGQGNITLKDCKVINNQGIGVDEWGAGGVLFGSPGNYKVIDCFIANNNSPEGASGLRAAHRAEE